MKKQHYTALIDCNNFFVSCERIFRPDLLKKPVAVLSSNDGCIVARSSEVKSLGVPMGIPYFKVKDILLKENVTLFSGNFALYGDISKRIMSIIEEYCEEVEIYSIDEAFVSIGTEEKGAVKQAEKIKRAIESGVGVPVSIGISKTKTLAKLAGEYAKHNPDHKGIFLINETSRAEFLKKTDIAEVWGVGSQTSIKLRERGISTAYALVTASDSWIRATLGLGGLRIALELRGEEALGHNIHTKTKKSILSSRSFGKKTSEYKDLEQSVAGHVTSVAHKMRMEGSGTGYISVFIRSKRRGGVSGTTSSGFRVLLSPTTDTLELITHALDILQELYKKEVQYEKTGVLISNLIPIDSIPSASLFEELGSSNRQKLMQTMDEIEKKHGKHALFPAAMGIESKRSWSFRKQFSSAAFTTEWSSIPVVKTG